jgi:Family of unknown function (DUF6683)
MKLILLVLAGTFATAAADTPGGLSIDRTQLSARHAHAAPDATRVPPRTPPRMPGVLASSAGARSAELEKTYAQLLAAFEQSLDKARLARNDVAVAAAMYIVGSYAAYHGADVSDAAFVAIANQIRDVLAATPGYAGAPLAQKQDMYEGLAIVGTLMLAAAKTKGGDASVRANAKNYLEALFHGDVDALQITDAGMSFAGAATSAPSPAAAPPAASFPATKVTAVLWTSRAEYRAFPENSMVMVETTYMLLADGTCTSRVPGSLEGYDPAADRAAHPKSWCKWRGNSGSYELAWNGGKWESAGAMTVIRAAKPGERLDGTWSRSKTGVVGTASTWRGTTIVLTAGGRFDVSMATHFTTNAHPGSREPVVSATQSSGDHTGTYKLDGFSIELHYDSGKVERRMFGVSSDAKHSWVRLNDDMMPKK